MTEAQLTREVMRLAGELRLLWHHCPDSRRCKGSPGLPDLLIIGRRGLLLAELKGPEGMTTAEQDWWLYQAGEAGAGSVLWRPADLESGRIRRELEALT